MTAREALPDAVALRGEIVRFFDGYAKASARYDSAAVADHYAYPAHFTNDTGQVVLVAVPTRESWTAAITGLLEMYRAFGVAGADVAELELAALSPRLTRATIHWVLRDRAGEAVYDFDVTYVIGRFDEGLRITSVVAHNEVPRSRAAAEARGITLGGRPG